MQGSPQQTAQRLPIIPPAGATAVDSRPRPPTPLHADSMQSAAPPWVATARQQAGVIGRHQLLAQGGSHALWRQRVGSGRWRRPLDGVAVIPELDEGVVTRAWVAWLGVGGRGVVSHLTAVALHGWPAPSEPAAHVTLPRGASCRTGRQGVVCFHTSAVPATSRSVIRGLPVTDRARTLADCLTLLPGAATVDALAITDAALAGDPSLAPLVASALRGRPGGRRGRLLLELADTGAESAAETRCRYLLVSAGLPAPETQLNIFSGDRFVCRADLGYRHLSIVIFIDSWQHHRSRQAFEHDRQQRAQLMAMGLVVLVVTAAELLASPERFIDQVRHLLEGGDSATPVEAGSPGLPRPQPPG